MTIVVADLLFVISLGGNGGIKIPRYLITRASLNSKNYEKRLRMWSLAFDLNCKPVTV